MVRRWQKMGLALLLTAGLYLLAREASGQNTPLAQPAPSNNATATTTSQPKAHARRKKAAPDPPAPQAPAPPPTLEQSPPAPPQVTYTNGQLTIVAVNATLSQVLRSVQTLTGTSVEMPSGASSVRVAGQLGPGQPRDVLNALLNGTKFNYIILGVTGDPGAVQKVILTTAKPATAVNTAQSNSAPPPLEEPQEEDSEPELQPVPPTPMRPHRPPNMPAAFNPQQPQPQPQPTPDVAPADNTQPNGGKTPEQLLQELQQMQQQQQQMQEQLNPANRQPQ
jgi:hypothetical protein